MVQILSNIVKIIGFLSEDMTYSCGIFEDLDGDMKTENIWEVQSRLIAAGKKLEVSHTTPPTPPGSDEDELKNAQMRKLHHIIRKAQIQPGHRILEIGSGWGSMAILIASTIPDTHIDTLTLSVQQQKLAQKRIEAVGLQDRITVHLTDYRNMPKDWGGLFDRLISIEMIESVGVEFLNTYWKCVDWALKEKGAVGVVQVITMPEARRCHLSLLFLGFIILILCF
jgi:cyclopropane-fatty-acyl-phospholipid synthase